jgi:membrane protease YdiL (CAAX protease family)
MLLSNAAEEFIWRGFLLSVLGQWIGNWIIAILVSSALYGSYHYALGPRDAILQGYNGGTYATVAVLMKGLLAPWLMHVTYNLLAVWTVRRYLAQWRKARATRSTGLVTKH